MAPRINTREVLARTLRRMEQAMKAPDKVGAALSALEDALEVRSRIAKRITASEPDSGLIATEEMHRALLAQLRTADEHVLQLLRVAVQVMEQQAAEQTVPAP